MTDKAIHTIEDFINKISVEDIKESEIIKDLLKKTNKDINNTNDEGEIKSWIESLPVLANILKELPSEIKENAQIVLEAHYGSNERVDAVIVGTRQTQINGKGTITPVMLFIENKRWPDLNKNYLPVRPTDYINDLCVIDNFHNYKYIPHPCVQVNRYEYLMKGTNKYVQGSIDAQPTEIRTAVFMQKATDKEVDDDNTLFAERYQKIIDYNPIFIGEDAKNIKKNTFKNIKNLKDYDKIKDNIKDLKDYIHALIDNGKPHLAEDIYESELQYSHDYRKAMSNLFGKDIKFENILDKQQLGIFYHILIDIISSHKKAKEHKPKMKLLDKKDKVVYIIEGSPGTGKSFLAVALLAYLYQTNATQESTQNVDDKNNFVIRIILKNKDPKKYYKEYYSKGEEKIKSYIHNAITIGCKVYKQKYDCLICDESHRMLKNTIDKDKNAPNPVEHITKIIEQSNVSVFFYDSEQSISFDDYITKDRIKKYCIKEGIKYKCEELKYQHRVSDSKSFLNVIRRMLYPYKYNNKIIKYEQSKGYKAALVKTPEELNNIIEGLNKVKKPEDIKNLKHPSRILAGRGRNKITGEDWHRKSGYRFGPLRKSSSMMFRWDSFYEGNDSYWLNCNSIRQVGCVDCSQGLDFEYVGIIIAPDIFIENDKIRIDLESHSFLDEHLGGTAKSLDEKQYKLGEKVYKEKSEWIDEDGYNKIWEKYKNDKTKLYQALGKQLQKKIVRNTYNVLLSRGEKGCFIFCCDKNLEDYLHNKDKFNFPYFKYIGEINKKKILHSEVCDCVKRIENAKHKVRVENFESWEDAIKARYVPCKHCLPSVYVRYKRSKEFHKNDCKTIKRDDVQEVFLTIEDAIKAGYVPCNYCLPSVYIGNKRSKVFHKFDCRSVKRLDKIEVFLTGEDAIKAGYVPCNHCLPSVYVSIKNHKKFHKLKCSFVSNLEHIEKMYHTKEEKEKAEKVGYSHCRCCKQ